MAALQKNLHSPMGLMMRAMTQMMMTSQNLQAFTMNATAPFFKPAAAAIPHHVGTQLPASPGPVPASDQTLTSHATDSDDFQAAHLSGAYHYHQNLPSGSRREQPNVREVHPSHACGSDNSTDHQGSDTRASHNVSLRFKTSEDKYSADEEENLDQYIEMYSVVTRD